jgi:hypothetical protein
MEVYIDDVVVKSVGFEEHTTDLKLSLQRMKNYGLQMNLLKCAIGVTSGRFLGFVVHEHGIQIDAKKIESIRKIGEPVCKKNVQKLLGKINYLRRFISNLVGRVASLLHSGLDIIKLFDTCSIKHIPREENSRANWLAQQASGYVVSQGVVGLHRLVWLSTGMHCEAKESRC